MKRAILIFAPIATLLLLQFHIWQDLPPVQALPELVATNEVTIGFVEEFTGNSLIIDSPRGKKMMWGIVNVEEFKNQLAIAQKSRIPVKIRTYQTGNVSAENTRIIQGVEPLDKDLIFPPIPGRQLPLRTRLSPSPVPTTGTGFYFAPPGCG